MGRRLWGQQEAPLRGIASRCAVVAQPFVWLGVTRPHTLAVQAPDCSHGRCDRTAGNLGEGWGPVCTGFVTACGSVIT